jgi:uncharacterized protein
MGSLHLQRHNYQAAGTQRRVLLHVPTTAVYELDGVSADVLAFFETQEAVDAEALRRRFDGSHPPGAVCDAVADFVALGVVAPGRKDFDVVPRPVNDAPINTLALTLTTGCNLGCSYCYRDDLAAPKAAQVMDEATARRAIDLLLRQAGARERVAVVFFGGEPLTRFVAIRELTHYAQAQAAAAGKKVDFSLTTNATLLDDEMIAFFQEHAFGIAVSIDGDEVEHDRRRITLGGKGTYRRVAANVARLLERCTARPVGARVTLSRGSTDVGRIYRHLHDDLGFPSVGFAPVTAAADSPLALGPDEMRRILDGMKALGRDYVKAAKRGQRHGFSNLDHLLLDLARGTRKALPCGAGLGMLAAATDGSLALCHRFTGTDAATFGDVRSGIDMGKLSAFVDAAQAPHASCRECAARSICAGGCYHEAYVQAGDLLAPTFAHCGFVREWLAFGLECFGEIVIVNPGFFETKKMEQRDPI